MIEIKRFPTEFFISYYFLKLIHSKELIREQLMMGLLFSKSSHFYTQFLLTNDVARITFLSTIFSLPPFRDQRERDRRNVSLTI